MLFAVVKKWKDNPNDFQILEYVQTYQAGLEYIKTQPKSADFEYEILKYN